MLVSGFASQARLTVLSAAAKAGADSPRRTAAMAENLARNRPGARNKDILAATKGFICWWLVCGFTCRGPREGPQGAGETQLAAARIPVLPLRGKRSSEIADSGEGCSEASQGHRPPCHPASLHRSPSWDGSGFKTGKELVVWRDDAGAFHGTFPTGQTSLERVTFAE